MDCHLSPQPLVCRREVVKNVIYRVPPEVVLSTVGSTRSGVIYRLCTPEVVLSTVGSARSGVIYRVCTPEVVLSTELS